MEDAQQPTAAERVRTLVEFHGMASLDVVGVPSGGPDGGGSALFGPISRALTPAGDLLLLVPAEAPAARAAAHARDDDLPAVMELTDVAPVSVAARIRGRAWVAGWITQVPPAQRPTAAKLLAERDPVGELLDTRTPATGQAARPAWTILQLEIGEATVDDLWGTGSVEPEDFAAAVADPIAAHEAELLQHLHAHHGGEVRQLCSLLGERAEVLCGATGTVVPVALDRFGLRVRFGDQHGHSFDARFDFPQPVDGVPDLRHAMHHLFEAAATA